MELTIVAPAFDEAAALPRFIDRTLVVLDALECSAEVVLVDDGSTDATWSIICAAAESDARVRGIRLSRNFGHQHELTAGLAGADGAAVVKPHSHLEHPPDGIAA